MKKARAKKEQKETATTTSVEGDHLQETTPLPTPPPIEEGITRNIPPYFSNIPHSNITLKFSSRIIGMHSSR